MEWETPEDKFERLQQMVIDQNETWDLSPNDKEAIKHVLGLVNYLAGEAADASGQTFASIMEGAHQTVNRIQNSTRG